MFGEVGSVASSKQPAAPVMAVVSDAEFGRALRAGLQAYSTGQEDEVSAHDGQAQSDLRRAQPSEASPAASHSVPQAEAYDHLDDILRHLEAVLSQKLGAPGPESRIDPIDPVFLAAMAQLGQLAGMAASQHHAPRHAAAAEAAQRPALEQRLLLPAGLMQRIAAMPDRARGTAFATLMAAIDRMPTVNRSDQLRKLLDGERHGGLSSRSLAALWSALNQARPTAAPAPTHGDAPGTTHDLPPSAMPSADRATIIGVAMPGPALEAARQAAPLAAPAHDAAREAGPAGVDTTGLARFLHDIDDERRPQYLQLMLDRTAPMPPPTRMALLRMAMQQADRPGCAAVLAGYVREQPRQQPIEQQGPAWSAMLRADQSGVDRSLSGALCRNLDLAIGQADWRGDMRQAAAVLARMPPEARPEPMRQMLGMLEHLPQPMRTAMLECLPPALHGLPDAVAASLRQAMAAQQALSEAIAPAPSALSALSGQAPSPLPDPAANLRAFAQALEAQDYADAEDALDAGEDQPGRGAAGREVGVVSFNRPGQPRFQVLMERLSREHPALMEQDQRGYRQAVERALARGSVTVGMSSRYPWPSSCDRDSEGGYLISINPNLLDCSLSRIVTALILQMRRAALVCSGDGSGLRGI